MRKRITALLLACVLAFFSAAPAAAAGKKDTNRMAGLTALHRRGLDGTGTVIAVIDSGLDVDHPSFSAEGMDGSAVKLKEADVQAKFSSLNAARLGRRVKAKDVYVSAKLPFVFDYTDGTADVSHSMDGAGDHGTGVACAAAGVETESCAAGAAPGAQLLIMKVFADHSAAASSTALQYAIEDAVSLGADVINLSLGEVSGFPDGENTYLKQLQAAAEAGIVICAAAGNEGSSVDEDGGHGTTGNVDIGLLSRPGTMEAVLSVASVNSAYFYGDGIFFRDVDGVAAYAAYNDTGPNYGLREFVSLRGAQGHEDGVYEYAVVPGIGTEEDFAEVDVGGRIALIRRGEITFVEKSDRAFAHGAVGVVVYNNEPGTVRMDLSLISQGNDLPCVILSQSDGEEMAAAAGENGIGRLTVLSGKELSETPNGGQPSGFSSWGPLSDLTLKPELSAVGGYVWTAVDGGGWDTLSGTSFAAPQAAGTAAALLQYVREEYGLTGTEARTRVQTLLMNTAQPQLQEDGVEVSPRKQGAGLIQADSAASSPVYVTVDGSALPKAELGDDKEQSGLYSFTFTVHNTADYEVRYVLHSSMNTETAQDGYMLLQARSLECVTEFSGQGVGVLCEYDSDGQPISYDVNGDGRLTLIDPLLLYRAIQLSGESGEGRLLIVPAGEEATVCMTVRLSDRERERLEEEFENGIYVEGFAYLDSIDVITPTVSIPILAFYGDWGKAPLFEESNLADPDCAGGYAILTGASSYLGENPVGEDETYIPARSNAMNTSKGAGGSITGIELDLLRNARSVTVEILSEGRVLLEHSAEDLVKAYSGNTAQLTLNFRPARYGLGGGSTFTVRITGEKDADGPCAVQTVEVPVYVDDTAPVIQRAELDVTEDGRSTLTVCVRDDFYTAGLSIYTADMRTLVGAWTLDQQTAGETVVAELDVTGLDLQGGRFVLCAQDYARNLSARTLS